MMRELPNYNTVSVSRAVTGFFIGFLLFHAWRRYPLRHRGIANVLEIGTVIGFVVLLNLHPTGPAYFIGHALFALIIYTFASDLGIVSRVLSLPVFQWLGSRSFSIYMFHGVVTTWIMLIVHAIEARIRTPLTADVIVPGDIKVHAVMLPKHWMNDALTLGYVAVVIIGASFIYRWVENPSRIYFSNLSSKMLKSPNRASDPGTVRGVPRQSENDLAPAAAQPPASQSLILDKLQDSAS
jgi:peptidoglycan/LPS O-acetylase OafA/YrhL